MRNRSHSVLVPDEYLERGLQPFMLSGALLNGSLFEDRLRRLLAGQVV